MVKNLSANAGEMALVPGIGRFPGEGNGNLLQYSWLGISMDRGVWKATVHGVPKESDMTWWLNNNIKPTQTSCIAHRTLLSVMWQPGWEESLERMDTCICMAEFGGEAVKFSSVTQSCPTLCDPMDCSTPSLPVHHQLLEFTQTQVL